MDNLWTQLFGVLPTVRGCTQITKRFTCHFLTFSIALPQHYHDAWRFSESGQRYYAHAPYAICGETCIVITREQTHAQLRTLASSHARACSCSQTGARGTPPPHTRTFCSTNVNPHVETRLWKTRMQAIVRMPEVRNIICVGWGATCWVEGWEI